MGSAADEARARLRGNAQRKEATAAVDSEKKAVAEAAGRASAAARVSAAQAAADADQADRNAPGRVEVSIFPVPRPSNRQKNGEIMDGHASKL